MSYLMLVVGFVSACSLGWFYSSGGADALYLSYHVSFLSFSRLRGNFCDSLDVYERPGEIVSASDVSDPCGLFVKPASA